MNDGGPAFPNGAIQLSMYETLLNKHPEICKEIGLINQYKWGMTLRDWFAGQALQGMCAQASSGLFSKTNSFQDIATNRKEDNESVFAQIAYDYADAMLKERNKPHD